MASFFVIALITAGAYFGFNYFKKSASETNYVLAKVERGTIVSTISGSGQVSSSNQVEIKSKASGDLVAINIKNGQDVRVGAVIAQIDSREAQKSVRDAQANLESAQLSHQKLVKPADELSMIQAENSLIQAKSDLEKAYDDGFNSVSNAFIDIPNVMTGLYDIIFGTSVSISKNQDNASAYADLVKNDDIKVAILKEDVLAKYKKAKDMYDKNFIDYRGTTRASQRDDIASLINETYDTTKSAADAVKSASDLLSFVKENLTNRSQPMPALLVTHQNSLASYIGSTNSNLLALLNIKNAITSSKYSIDEKTAYLDNLKKGADGLDIQSSELTIKQRENALFDAKEKLSDYFVRAPFDGTIAKINVKKADSVASGASIATFITKQKLAEISLNEVDVAKVKVGQKSTLTFDAIEGLGISGEVAEIDSIGTVSQGVVSYNVKISFDTQDDRIKPGMSTSASIITDVKQGVLIVPNSALKVSGATNYVEILDQPVGDAESNQGVTSVTPPRQQEIMEGISSDTSTEIISGLNEGDFIIVRTVSNSSAKTTQQAPSLFGGGGGFRPR